MRGIKPVIQSGDRLGEHLERCALGVAAGLASAFVTRKLVNELAGRARVLKGRRKGMPQGVKIPARLILPDRSAVGREHLSDRRAQAPVVGNGETTNVGPIGAETQRFDAEGHRTTNVEIGETTNPGKAEPTRRLSIDLPESWHRRFKIVCTKTDRKMIEEVTGFIKRRTVELETE